MGVPTMPVAPNTTMFTVMFLSWVGSAGCARGRSMFKLGLESCLRPIKDGPLMVKSGHARVVTVDFAPPAGVPSGLEVLRLTTLPQRASGLGSFRVPSRVTFHVLLTLSTGVITHTVDFERVEVRSGRWLWVRPVQAQQGGDRGAAGGRGVFFVGGVRL